MSALLGAAAALMLAQSFYTPAEAEGVFHDALAAYERQDAAAAREDLRRLAEHGFASPAVLYNLGTAYLAEGDLGGAVLYLERARRSGGAVREDAEAQLSLARARQLDQVVGAPTEIPLAQRLAEATSLQWAGWLFLVGWVAAFIALMVRRWVRGPRGRVLSLAAGLSFAASVPAGALLGVHAYVRRTVQEAVVVAQALPARESPAEGGRVTFEVHSGLKVRLLGREGNFVRILLPNGLEGWVEQGGVVKSDVDW
ncbi:MAG TPA: SH3 domain-containing protein [Myxococcaceae bacterium]|nr:SH3 domain-containing protein [Myxococcaceae bacterium]